MVRKNIASNIIGRAWSVISVYLFVPLYLKFLGIEAFGLVGFYSTLLGVLAFADMGFTATLNREMARLSVRDDAADEMRNLLRTFEVAYICITLVLSLTLWIFAPHIVSYWLRSGQLNPHEITLAIRLMGLAIALQLPSGLYVGGLMGLQMQVRANHLQIAWGLYRGIGGVLILWLFSPTIIAFSFWQLAANAVYFFMTRRSLWRALAFDLPKANGCFRWQIFRNTWRYGAGMAGMAVVSTVLTQSDKLAVSKMLTLEMLGFYTLAGSLAAVPLMLASPIASAVFPRLTAMVIAGDHAKLVHLYHRSTELVAVAIIPSALTLAFFSADFIRAWTGIAATAQGAELAASFLLGGQLMQAITLIPFYVALAHGNVKLNLQIGIASLAVIIPLLIYLIMQFGIAGAGLSWFILNICTLPPYMYILHRRFLKGQLLHWCVHGIGRPILAALPCVMVGRLLMPYTESRLLTFCSIGIVWLIATTASILLSREVRQEIFVIISKVFVSRHTGK